MARLTGKTLLKLGLVGLLAWTLFASGMLVAEASHDFSDVPTTAFYHAAVSWIVARAITAGCAVGLYCPDNAVTRGQMAVFLQKLGLALTPTYLSSVGSDTSDAGGTKCQTTSHTPPFPQRAFLHAGLSLKTTSMGAPTFWNAIVQFSTNGGGSWSQPTPAVSHQVSTEPNKQAYSGAQALMNLDPGTNYLFSVAFSGATGVVTEWYCGLWVRIDNRNP